jgi:transcriptional regulator with XRE-family HTH domain
LTRIAEKFEFLLNTYRRPDGERWGGQELQDATGGAVTRSYASALRNGHIENPGYDKLRAIAKAMKFPVELWFEDSPGRAAPSADELEERATIAERLEHLFETIVDDKKSRPYTNAELARMSLGGISEQEVAGIRSGEISSPTIDQVLALAEAFGVSPSYFTERKAPLLSQEAIEALADRDSSEIIHKTLALSEAERRMVLDILDHLGQLQRRREDGPLAGLRR